MEIPRISTNDRNHIKDNKEQLEVTTKQWDVERDWVSSPVSIGILAVEFEEKKNVNSEYLRDGKEL